MVNECIIRNRLLVPMARGEKHNYKGRNDLFKHLGNNSPVHIKSQIRCHGADAEAQLMLRIIILSGATLSRYFST